MTSVAEQRPQTPRELEGDERVSNMTTRWYGLDLPSKREPWFMLPENQVRCDLCGSWITFSRDITTPAGDFICADCDARADAAEAACRSAVRRFEQDEYDAYVADGGMFA